MAKSFFVCVCENFALKFVVGFSNRKDCYGCLYAL